MGKPVSFADNSESLEASIPHVLVVDDDLEVSALLRRYLTPHGFMVSAAADGRELRKALQSGHVDLILLDLGLPGENGLDLTRYLHTYWHGSVIIVSGRGESVDRIVGLELGADDYITKPFDLRELLARVRSVMRRAIRREDPVDVKRPATLAFRGYRLDTAAHVLRTSDGGEVPLTSGEYDLLKLFLEHPHKVLSRNDIMSQIHGREAGPFDRAIDVQIGRLRRKIDVDSSVPSLLKAIRGVGYMFAEQVERE